MMLYNRKMKVPFDENSFNPNSAEMMGKLSGMVLAILYEELSGMDKLTYAPALKDISLLGEMYVARDGIPYIDCNVRYGYLPKN